MSTQLSNNAAAVAEEMLDVTFAPASMYKHLVLSGWMMGV